MNESAAQLVVLTDLDGSLLDADTYSYKAAAEALDVIHRKGIPLILVSSKTRAEIEPLRYQLNHRGPFVAENGGGLFIPKGFFDFPLKETVVRGPYQVIELGTPYAVVRSALKEIGQKLGCAVKGFGDMSAEEVARRTGLSQAEAVLAKQREYDEPFIIDGPGTCPEEIRHEAEARGLVCVRGGRFQHLSGPTDKGQACRYLIDCFRRQPASRCTGLRTIGIGDTLNDLPMLMGVDQAVLVQRPDGSYDPEVDVPALLLAPGIGPVGWNRALLNLLNCGS
jgi:mannosyl-3-phosphoglycerate phosphatase